MTSDISNRPQIDAIIKNFYDRLLTDAAIGFFFTDIAKINLASHLPKIGNFWEAQLFKSMAFSGDLYSVHKQLHLKVPLSKDHFDWWLYLFCEAVNKEASGPKAEIMKERASLIASSMHRALDKNEPHMGLVGLGIHPAD